MKNGKTPAVTGKEFAALEPRLQRAAEVFDMLSELPRLHIMGALLDGERPVMWLAEHAKLSQPAMSHHLRKLRECGLVAARRDGQKIMYRISGNEAKAMFQALHSLYCVDGDS